MKIVSLLLSFPFQENTDESLATDTMLSLLVEMGYLPQEAVAAIDRCGAYRVLKSA